MSSAYIFHALSTEWNTSAIYANLCIMLVRAIGIICLRKSLMRVGKGMLSCLTTTVVLNLSPGLPLILIILEALL